MIYAALRAQGASYTPEQVGDLITFKNMPVLVQGLYAAFNVSAQETEEAGEGG